MVVHQNNNIPLEEHGEQNKVVNHLYDDFNDSTANNNQNDHDSFYIMDSEEIINLQIM